MAFSTPYASTGEPGVAYSSQSSDQATADEAEATASAASIAAKTLLTALPPAADLSCSQSSPPPSPQKMQTLSELSRAECPEEPAMQLTGPAQTLREILEERLGELKERLLLDLEHLFQDSKGSPAAAMGHKALLATTRHDSRESLASSASAHQSAILLRAAPNDLMAPARSNDLALACAGSMRSAVSTNSKLEVPGIKLGLPSMPRFSSSRPSKGHDEDDSGVLAASSNASGVPVSAAPDKRIFTATAGEDTHKNFRSRLKSIFSKMPVTQDASRVAAEPATQPESEAVQQGTGSLNTNESRESMALSVNGVACGRPDTPSPSPCPSTRPSAAKGRSMVSFMFGRNMNEPEVKGGYKPCRNRAVRAHAPALVRARTCETTMNQTGSMEADHTPRPSSAGLDQVKTLDSIKAMEIRGSTTECGNFEVAQVWGIKPDGRHSKSFYFKGSKVKGFGTGLTKNLDIYNIDEVDPEDAANPFHTCFHRVSVQQTSRRRIFWDFLGFIMVSYDFIMIPLQLFEISEGTVQTVLSNVARIYWTLDIFMSFITTQVLPSGKMVNNFRTIANSYLRSWFLFDFSIVTFDWIDWISTAGQNVEGGGSQEGSDGSTDFIRSMRVLRIVRMLRLVRLLLNAPEMTRFVVYYVRSEKVLVVMGIVKIMFFVVGLTHIMACGWYGVGTGSGEEGWVATEALQGGSLGARYASAFYWSVAQFTGASSQIPRTTNERIYGILVQLLAFVNSVSIVSSLTTLMTRLQLITAQSATQMSVLRRYLMDNRISSKIATRVLRNANHVIDELKRNTPESDVELMSLISHPLRVELRYEVHSPTLTQHPFFFCYNKTNPAAMRQCCYNAIGKLQVSKGDVLFSAGEVLEDSDMFFVLKGVLKHSRECRKDSPKASAASELVEMTIPEGCWLHEAALWTSAWTFTGMVRASSECGLLCIKKQNFQNVASQYRTTEFYPAQYANAFVEELNLVHPDSITEISEMIIDIEHLVSGVFPDEVNSMYNNRKRTQSSKLSSFLRRSEKNKMAKGKVVPTGELTDAAAPGAANRLTTAPGGLAYIENPIDEEVYDSEKQENDGKEPCSEFTSIAP